jgi:hypothetical protein
VRHFLSIVFGAAFTAAVCWSLGRLLFARMRIALSRIEHDLLAGITGAPLLSLLVFALCATGLARVPVMWIVGLSALAACWRWGGIAAGPGITRAVFPALPRLWRWIIGLPVAFYGVIYLANSIAPENSPDGMAYHLGLVYRYFRQYGFGRLTTNMYGNLSQGVEMLFLFAFSFGRNAAAATVHCCFLFALPLMLLSYGRRIGRPVAGACAGMLVYLSPLDGIDGVSAYNDVALAAVAFATYYLLEIWRERSQAHNQPQNDALLIPIGLLAGFCFAIKYTGFVAPMYASAVLVWELAIGGMVPWRIQFHRLSPPGTGFRFAWERVSPEKRVLRPKVMGMPHAVYCLATLVAMTSIMALPWLVKNWIVLGNPVSPFLNRLFPNPFTHVTFEDDYLRYFRSYDLPSLKPLFWMLTVKGQLGGQIGPVFLLAPLALLTLRLREGRHLLLALLFFLLPYPQNLGARFLIPVLPFAAMGIALALEFSQATLAILVMAAAFLAWPRTIDKYRSAGGGWQIEKVPWQAALGIVPQDTFLLKRSGSWVTARMLDQYVPRGKRVWSTSPVAEAYSTTDVLVNYYSAEGELIQDILTSAQRTDLQPTLNLRYTFPSRTVERLRIVQNAESDDIWSIGEMRFFLGSQEIRPDGRWKLDAWPFPWDIRLALDRNPTTRWRAWEPSRAGMHVDVDFGGPVELDRVELHGSHDQGHLKVQLEAIDAKLERLEDEPLADLRRMAVATVKARGIDYLLVGGDHWLTPSIHGDPEGWGLKLIADRGDAWLMQIQ